MSQRKISKSDLNIVLQRLNDELKKKHPAHATIILEKQMGVGYGLMAVGHGYSAPFPTHAWPRSRMSTREMHDAIVWMTYGLQAAS